MLDDSGSVEASQFQLEKQFATQAVNSYDVNTTGVLCYVHLCSLLATIVIDVFDDTVGCFSYCVVIDVLHIGSWMGIVRFSDRAWVELDLTSSRDSLLNKINGFQHKKG